VNAADAKAIDAKIVDAAAMLASGADQYILIVMPPRGTPVVVTTMCCHEHLVKALGFTLDHADAIAKVHEV
jgi:hypothetical protein